MAQINTISLMKKFKELRDAEGTDVVTWMQMVDAVAQRFESEVNAGWLGETFRTACGFYEAKR